MRSPTSPPAVKARRCGSAKPYGRALMLRPSASVCTTHCDMTGGLLTDGCAARCGSTGTGAAAARTIRLLSAPTNFGRSLWGGTELAVSGEAAGCRDPWHGHVRSGHAVHRVVDKAALVVAEDLTKTYVGRKRLGKNTNRRLAGWTKGLTAEALNAVSDRRGSAVRLVNAAYTSQVIPGTDALGVRKGDRLHCTDCGAVWQADHAGAVNVLARASDPDIALWTPHTRVKQILLERTDRRRSRLPDQDSNTEPQCQCGERNIRTLSNEQLKEAGRISGTA